MSRDWSDVLELLESGASLRSACEKVGVNRREFFTALHADARLANQYARAREIQADGDADDIRAIAERMTSGELTSDQARVMVDALKWSAGRRSPRKFGDRVSAEISGPEGGPIKVDQSAALQKLSDAVARLAARQSDGE